MAKIITTGRSLLAPLLLAAVVGHLAGLLTAGSSPQVTLEVAVVGGGQLVNLTTGTADSATSSCRQRCRWEQRLGQTVRLLPRPAPGWRWAGWQSSTTSPDCQPPAGCSLPLASDQKMTANFRPRQLTRLDIETNGSGSGSLLSRPTAIACGADCSEQFLAGATVDLVALPAPGSFFSGWTGAQNCGSAALCRIRIKKSMVVRATFSADSGPLSPALNVYNPQRNRGVVLSAPEGIRCGQSCTQEFLSGSPVRLLAKPRPGYRFAGWFGPGCSGQDSSCQLAIADSVAISAKFVPQSGASAGSAKVIESWWSKLTGLLTVGVLSDLLQESRKHRLASGINGSSLPPRGR